MKVLSKIACLITAAVICCDAKDLTPGFTSICANPSDFNPDTVILSECRGKPQTKGGVAKDLCEKSDCKYVDKYQMCVCKDKTKCDKVGGIWFIEKCGKTVLPLVQGFNSCDCKIDPRIPHGVRDFVSHGTKCCGGKPLMCPASTAPKKDCEKKYFCKANQYVGKLIQVETYPGSKVEVGSQCTDCPAGAKCDGSITVKCDDKKKYFKDGKCIDCPSDPCPTEAPKTGKEVNAAASAPISMLMITFLYIIS